MGNEQLQKLFSCCLLLLPCRQFVLFQNLQFFKVKHGYYIFIFIFALQLSYAIRMAKFKHPLNCFALILNNSLFLFSYIRVFISDKGGDQVFFNLRNIFKLKLTFWFAFRFLIASWLDYCNFPAWGFLSLPGGTT